MKKKITSIDGFTLRRSGKSFGGLPDVNAKKSKIMSKRSTVHNSKEIISPASIENHAKASNKIFLDKEPKDNYMSRSDISETLFKIDDKQDFDLEPTRRKCRRLKKEAKKAKKNKKTKFRRILRGIIRLIVLVAMAYVVYAGYKFITNSHNIFNGNIFQAFQSQPLKKDKNGRSNFLIIGTSEDDTGHDAPNLADTIIVVSIDQDNKNAYTFSVPRDLYVKYDKPCAQGNSGIINAYFFCANDGESNADEQDRLTKMQKLVGEIFDLDIQYGVHVNYTVVTQAVDAVGGIDVDVQGSGGAPGVMDRHFDYQCDYKCYLVKYDNGVHHLNGTQAINLARVRGSESSVSSYGLVNNFDREINQQKIIIALKDKAVSSGTLTNFNKVMGLIDALGNNLRTNIQTKEIRTLVDVAIKTKPNDIRMINLVGYYGDEAVLTDKNGINVLPVAGMYNYEDVQAYISKKLSSNPIVRENAPIVVLNGSGVDGLGQTKSDGLTDLDFNVKTVDTAPQGQYAPVEIYQIGDKSSKTAEKLTSMYNVTIKNTEPPIAVDEDVEFVIIYGQSESAQIE